MFEYSIRIQNRTVVVFQAFLKGVQTVVINCMTLRSSHSIFPLLAEKLGTSRGHSDGKLEKLLTSSGPTV